MAISQHELGYHDGTGISKWNRIIIALWRFSAFQNKLENAKCARLLKTEKPVITIIL